MFTPPVTVHGEWRAEEGKAGSGDGAGRSRRVQVEVWLENLFLTAKLSNVVFN